MNKDRFRFRVFDKKTQTYLKHYAYYICESGFIYENQNAFGDYALTEIDNVIIEQCAGVKDKNGTLIFEGDVVRDKIGRTFIVRYIDDDFCWYLEENTTPQIMNGFPLQKRWVGITSIEIIGNIHEE